MLSSERYTVTYNAFGFAKSWANMILLKLFSLHFLIISFAKASSFVTNSLLRITLIFSSRKLFFNTGVFILYKKEKKGSNMIVYLDLENLLKEKNISKNKVCEDCKNRGLSLTIIVKIK